jgi:flagellar hook-length control protein FliK
MSGVAMLANLLGADRPSEPSSPPAARCSESGKAFGSVLAGHMSHAREATAHPANAQRAKQPKDDAVGVGDRTPPMRQRAQHGRTAAVATSEPAEQSAATDPGATPMPGPGLALSPQAVTAPVAGSAAAAPECTDTHEDTRPQTAAVKPPAEMTPLTVADASARVAKPSKSEQSETLTTAAQPERAGHQAPTTSSEPTAVQPPTPNPAQSQAGSIHPLAVQPRPARRGNATPQVETAPVKPAEHPAAVAPAAVQPPTATSAAAPVAAPAEPRAPATPPVAQPALESALTRLRTRPSGTHELTVQLHPADLGAVRVVAILSGDRLDVTVLCADHSAQQAVAAAVPALHDKLAELRHVDISAWADQAGSGSADGSYREPQGHSGRPSGPMVKDSSHRQESVVSAADTRRPARAPSADGRFDRRI